MSLSSICGQALLKSRIREKMAACEMRGRPFPHVFIEGLPGTGKTTLAHAVSDAMGYLFVQSMADSFRNVEAINNALIKWDKDAKTSGRPMMFFVDEVHRLSREKQEAFYYPMLESRIVGAGESISLAPFTLVVATTARNKLDPAFCSRFPEQWILGRYSRYQIESMIYSLFHKESIVCTRLIAREIASRCLGIPRAMANLVDKVIDRVIVRGGNREVTIKDVHDVFMMEGLDSLGFNRIHHRYLLVLSDCKPKGKGVLAARLSMSINDIETIVEPLLIAEGFVELTSRGRVITKAGLSHLKKE